MIGDQLVEIFDGLDLMWKGMIIVFGFLILLMVTMYLIPYITKSVLTNKDKKVSKTKTNDPGDHNSDVISNEPEKHTFPSDDVIAAIAAAIYSHTGKTPKQLYIAPANQAGQQYNVWGVAGRQDLMVSRDITGQVGFQY